MSAPPVDPHYSWFAPPAPGPTRPLSEALRIPKDLPRRARAALFACLTLMDDDGVVDRGELREALDVDDGSERLGVVELEAFRLARRLDTRPARLRLRLSRIFAGGWRACATCSRPLHSGPANAVHCARCIAGLVRSDRTWHAVAFEAFMTAKDRGASDAKAVYAAHVASGKAMWRADKETTESFSKELDALVPWLLSHGLLEDAAVWRKRRVASRVGDVDG